MKKSNEVIAKIGEYTIVYKPVGILSQPAKNEEESVLSALQAKNKRDFFLCNRIDRPVSGMLVLSDSPKGQQRFAQASSQKIYYAITHKSVNVEEVDTIKVYLRKDGRKNKALVKLQAEHGYKAAKLDYRLVHELDNYFLMRIEIDKGRFHQIRALMAHVGCPIKGDVKYGARRANKDRSIHLHNNQIIIPDLNINETVLPDETDTLWAKCTKYF